VTPEAHLGLFLVVGLEQRLTPLTRQKECKDCQACCRHNREWRAILGSCTRHLADRGFTKAEVDAVIARLARGIYVAKLLTGGSTSVTLRTAGS
jgi:hypothetical protein